MRCKTYESLLNTFIAKDPPPPQPNDSLHIEIPPIDIVIRPLKATLRKETHNPNAQEAQHYFIVEDQAQAPCMMSTLEVVQKFPTQ